MAQTLAHSTSRRHVVLADTLASAAKLGHVVAAEGALAELPDVNTPVRGYTALGWAAVYGHANVAYRILAHKTADVNLRSGPDDAWTPLMLAVCEGHGDVVDLLLSYPETDPNLTESHGEFPLYCAALKNHLGILQALCNDSRVDVNQRTGLDGSTALCVASELGRIEMVKVLMAHPSLDPNAGKHDGWTPLHIASGRGHEAIVDALLAHSDIRVNTPGGRDCSIALLVAVAGGHLGVVRRLLATTHGVNGVNHSNMMSATPILQAVVNGHTDIVRLLLEQPVAVDIDTAIFGSLNPEELARVRGHTAIVALLQEYRTRQSE